MKKVSSVSFVNSIEHKITKFQTDVVLDDIKKSKKHFSVVPSFISLFALRDLINNCFSHFPSKVSRTFKSNIPASYSLRVSECFGWRVLLSIEKSLEENISHNVIVHFIDRIDKKKAIDETIKDMLSSRTATPPPSA